MRKLMVVIIALSLLNLNVVVSADVFNMGEGFASLDFVSVGNPGNANDTHGDGYGREDYTYKIGKFEVTAGQYTEFLNAVAATDTYKLYDNGMGMANSGCKIVQSGTSGNYTYSVPDFNANRPVNEVSWADAARFANWLQNGQPDGAQDLTTTEDGSYYLNGAMLHYELLGIVREADARYVIPSENEWYKAAYYDPSKPGGAGYWDYPTGTDDATSSDRVDPDPGNNANYAYQIGLPDQFTEVGDFENSESPYGTFDQGGNVLEWTDTSVPVTLYCVLRGASFNDYNVENMRADHRDNASPASGYYTLGFRIAEVPEPATITLLILGGMAMMRRRQAPRGM